jgi:undecaprenyl pyrophosphate synthase
MDDDWELYSWEIRGNQRRKAIIMLGNIDWDKKRSKDVNDQRIKDSQRVREKRACKMSYSGCKDREAV